MKETGLMFKAPLVRSILDGSKTQTRRLVKPQPVAGQGMVNAAYCGDRNLWLRDGPCDKTDPAKEWRCPMGQPGDRIYVRETFVARNGGVQYRADLPDLTMKWTPAIHMPKALARIWLDITSVRVERLQDISEADAIAEGIERMEDFIGCPCWRDYSEPEGANADVCPDDPIGSFQSLWESTGGDWAANPWCWVIDFKRDQAQKGL